MFVIVIALLRTIMYFYVCTLSKENLPKCRLTGSRAIALSQSSSLSPCPSLSSRFLTSTILSAFIFTKASLYPLVFSTPVIKWLISNITFKPISFKSDRFQSFLFVVWWWWWYGITLRPCVNDPSYPQWSRAPDSFTVHLQNVHSELWSSCMVSDLLVFWSFALCSRNLMIFSLTGLRNFLVL